MADSAPPLPLADVHGVEIEFGEVQASLLFLIALWLCGKAASACGLPSLVGELCVGVICGPQLLSLVPYASSLSLYGEVGLILLVVEAGLDVDLQMLRMIGPRGVAIALTGTALPVAMAAALGAGVIGLSPVASLAAGCTLAPTSMGIALNVLKKGQVLNTPTGQLIIAAAVLDDVIALLLLTLLQSIAARRSAFALLTPVLASAGLMLVAGAISRWGMPQLLARAARAAPRQLLAARGGLKDKYLLLILLGLACAFIPLAHSLGASHLLGAFLAGLCCCTEPRLHAAWTKQVKRLQTWLLKLFFAASCGFAVPVRSFSSAAVFGRAGLFFLAALGKLATGVWATPLTRANATTVGFAMAAWGEFAFIIATASLNGQLLDQTTFAALLLAVLFSVVVSPVLLRATIQRSRAKLQSTLQDAVYRADGADDAPLSGGGRDSDSPPSAGIGTGARSAHKPPMRTAPADSGQVPVFFRLRTSAPPSWGLSVKAIETMSANGLDVLDFRSHSYNGLVLFEAYLREPRLRVATARPLPPEDEERLRARQGELLRVFVPLFGGGGSCVLERWQPGEGAAAAARMAREGNPAGFVADASPTEAETARAGARRVGVATGAHEPAAMSSGAAGVGTSGFPPSLAPGWARESTEMDEDDLVGDRSYKYWARSTQFDDSPFHLGGVAPSWAGAASLSPATLSEGLPTPQPLPSPACWAGDRVTSLPDGSRAGAPNGAELHPFRARPEAAVDRV